MILQNNFLHDTLCQKYDVFLAQKMCIIMLACKVLYARLIMQLTA